MCSRETGCPLAVWEAEPTWSRYESKRLPMPTYLQLPPGVQVRAVLVCSDREGIKGSHRLWQGSQHSLRPHCLPWGCCLGHPLISRTSTHGRKWRSLPNCPSISISVQATGKVTATFVIQEWPKLLRFPNLMTYWICQLSQEASLVPIASLLLGGASYCSAFHRSTVFAFFVCDPWRHCSFQSRVQIGLTFLLPREEKRCPEPNVWKYTYTCGLKWRKLKRSLSQPGHRPRVQMIKNAKSNKNTPSLSRADIKPSAALRPEWALLLPISRRLIPPWDLAVVWRSLRAAAEHHQLSHYWECVEHLSPNTVLPCKWQPTGWWRLKLWHMQAGVCSHWWVCLCPQPA